MNEITTLIPNDTLIKKLSGKTISIKIKDF